MGLKGNNVSSIEQVIIKTKDVSVRIIELRSHEVADWHYHTEITDNMFCLTGNITVRLKEPDEELVLSPGRRCEVMKGRVHQVANAGADIARYLLVQGVGNYDFNVVNS
jgi:quercetin dioxygenase-like cupin family protein